MILEFIKCPTCNTERELVQDEDEFFCGICGYKLEDIDFEYTGLIEAPVVYTIHIWDRE